jgi:hypothetical protein
MLLIYVTDSLIAMSISLLPHLYPPKQMKKIRKKSFKPSIGLAKDSILKFANVSMHLFITNCLFLIGFVLI